MIEDVKIVTLTPPVTSLDDAHLVRRRVFVEEQGVDEHLDFDDKDKNAVQCVAYIGDSPVGTARMRMVKEDTAKLERLGVLKEHRGKHIGNKILNAMETYAKENGITTLTMDAQCHAQPFYEKQGYIPNGEVFEEVGHSHIKMAKKL